MTDDLLEGFATFRKEEYEGKDALMPALVSNGQDPDYFIISCIDSRTNPGKIFNAPPGTFFAHKAMGAIVRPYKKGTALAAALQFALKYNNVRKLIVLGHTGCGAVQALLNGIEDEDIAEFVNVAEKSKCGTQRATEEKIVLQSAENLKTYPSVQNAIAEGQTTIKPWLFEMETGTMWEYSDATKTFGKIGN